MATEMERPRDDAGITSLDWGSLGRLVRQRTLHAVALHFAAIAQQHDSVLPPEDTRRQRIRE
jgi:hypothetical protein